MPANEEKYFIDLVSIASYARIFELLRPSIMPVLEVMEYIREYILPKVVYEK